MNKSTIIFCFSMLFAVMSTSQDAHFSQFYAVPYNINPALTGAINGTYRLIADYRDQWGGALDSPFNTFAMGGDVNFQIGKDGVTTNDRFGVGLLFSSDRNNIVHFNTNEISLFGAYHKSLDSKGRQMLGAGFKFGVVQKNVNYDNLIFEDSFNQVDAFNIPTGEDLPPNNFGFLDLSIGINYRVKTRGESQFYFGAASHHLTQSNVSFYNNQDDPNPDIELENKLFARQAITLGLDQQISEFWQLQPRVVYQIQGPHQELNLGTNLKHSIIRTDKSIYLGMWLRTVKSNESYAVESLIPLLGLQLGNFILGMSYDVQLSETTGGNFGFNAFELSIRFIGEHDNDSTFCPEF